MASEIKQVMDITIALTYDDDSAIEALIVDEDNNSPSRFLPNMDYYLRLYKSNEDISVIAKTNFGSITLSNNYVGENISNEIIVLGGENSAISNKMIFENFRYSNDGMVFDKNLNVTTPVLSFTKGSKNIRSLSEIYGVFSISYYSRYSLYKFRASRTGNLLISLIGS